MKSLISVLAGALLIAAFGSGMTFAQSSGSYNYNYDATACTDVSGALGGGTENDTLKTTMKVSSGNGVGIVVRPSAVVGLLTDVSLSGKSGGGTVTQSAQETVQFKVTATPLSGQAAPSVTPGDWVTYDDRFIQISTNLFSLLSTCTSLTPDTTCFFNFNETTLSAHSFDWVVTDLSSGNYGITVSWRYNNNGTTAPNQALACVGPVVLTAEQAKLFNQSTVISF
jgi:hypothetical protein